jgi:hypothetical protein
MAIKGKRKSKPRSAPRAPRREPVSLPTPFLQRRWVQAAAAFLIGAFAVVLVVWVTNNLRADDAATQADADAAARRTAATAYQRAVQGAFGTVGVVEPGVPPTVFTDMDAALDDMVDGDPPADAAATFDRAAADAAKARKELAVFDVSGTVADQGFDTVAVTSFTSSADRLVHALDLYRQAALVAASAAAVGGAEREQLAKVAADLRDTAKAQLDRGWIDYLQAIRSGGVAETPTGGGNVPALGGGG